MGKRSQFAKNKHDKYYTPYLPILPLVPHLPTTPFTYAEPCAGDGSLINHLTKIKPNAKCLIKCDIEPDREDIIKESAFNIDYTSVDMIITNPPWTRDILHDLIIYLSNQKPTWLLFDHDWIQTEQSIPYMDRCTDIVPIGRVKWFANTKKQSKDSCSWYRFTKDNSDHKGSDRNLTTRIHKRMVNKTLIK